MVRSPLLPRVVGVWDQQGVVSPLLLPRVVLKIIQRKKHPSGKGGKGGQNHTEADVEAENVAVSPQ